MNNVTDLTSIRASAVPSAPRTITATQRLAALELAQKVEDYLSIFGDSTAIFAVKLMRDSSKLCRELAGDAKGER